jgi:LysM repeat protein
MQPQIPMPGTTYESYPNAETVRAQDAVSKRGSPTTCALILAAGLLLLLLTCLPLMTGIAGYVYYQMSGRIAPGVHVGETSLSWMTVEDAAIAIQKEWNMEHRLVVSDGFQTLTVSQAELGLEVNAVETARSAFGVARRQAMWDEFGQMVRGWLDGSQVAPVAVVDQQSARLGLERLNEQFTRPARDASLTWDGSQLVVIPSELGYTINISETLEVLETSPGLVLTSGYLRLPLAPLIPPISDVDAALEQADRLLDTPLTLRGYDPIQEEHFLWDVPRSEIGSWLKFDSGDDGPIVGIDPDKLTAYLNGLGSGLGGDRWLDSAAYSPHLAQAIQQGSPFLILVNHRPTTYVIQPGETLISIAWKLGVPYWMILQANPELDPDALQAGQSLDIPSKDELLPLPIVPNKRIVISISEQRLWVFLDGKLLSEHVISTGINRSPTQPGIFQVQSHELEAYASVWDLYMPHFLGVYEAWPGFMNGIHGLPRLSNGQRLWKNILGKPASYGCIIMDLNEAEWLYNWAEPGVVVDIRP